MQKLVESEFSVDLSGLIAMLVYRVLKNFNSNAAGAPAIVAYDDAAAATSSRWTEWRIALQAFADQGIDLTNVDKIAIGLGSKGGTAAGGSGTMYIDDIRLYRQ